MLHLVKKLSMMTSITMLVVVIGFGSAPTQVSFATPSPATISARISTLSGISTQDISEIYALEQGAKIIIIAADINIPAVIEPKVGYLLLKNAATGDWTRVIIDLTEWNTDFRPYFDENGVEVHQQPLGTIDSLTAGQEVAQVAVVATMTGVVVANVIFAGSSGGNESDRNIIFIHTDLLGSPVVETDKQGSVQ